MPDQTYETVTVEFTLAVRNGELAAKATVPAGPTNLTQLLPVLQSLEDSFLKSAIARENEEGAQISCRAGCGACCRQMVPLSIYEAEILQAWIQTLSIHEQQALAERFHLALLSLKDSGLIDRLVTEDWLDDTDAARAMAVDYFYQGVACPFLVEESCSIHPIRPLVCREYLVTSPPDNCADVSHQKVDRVGLPFYLSRALYKMGGEAERDDRGWFPLVFLFAWMKSDSHPGQAWSGTGPQLLYEVIKRLGSQEKAAS